MSYATMQDLLFSLDMTEDLTDSELRDRPTAEPELPEERSELRRTRRPKAGVKIIRLRSHRIRREFGQTAHSKSSTRSPGTR